MSAESNTITGFAPIAKLDAEILILGTMPSVESLKHQQYYAHPRNGFWPIMAALFNFAKGEDYATRCDHLINNKIAVWDVLQHCQRQGSLDSDIKSNSIVSNDFRHFLDCHPKIRLIAFNGAKAEQLYTQHVLSDLIASQAKITRCRLPSTSPAHASLSLKAKHLQWQQALINSPR